METLEHEKFQGVKELAEIGMKISASTAALAQLKAGEETYLTEREEKLVARLKAALVDSSDLIKEIGANHDALVGYKNDLTAFHDRILSLIQGVDACMALITEGSAQLDARITEHENKIADFKQDSIRERVALESEQGELSGWRDRLGEAQRLLDDRNKLLQETITRTKK